MTKENKKNVLELIEDEYVADKYRNSPYLNGRPHLNSKLTEFLNGFPVGAYYFEFGLSSSIITDMFKDAKGTIGTISLKIKKSSNIKKIVKKNVKQFNTKIIILTLIKNGKLNEQLKDIQEISKTLGIRIVVIGDSSPMINSNDVESYVKTKMTESTFLEGEYLFVNTKTNEELIVSNVVKMK